MFLLQLWHTHRMQHLETESFVLLAYAISAALITFIVLGSWLKNRSTNKAITRLIGARSDES